MAGEDDDGDMVGAVGFEEFGGGLNGSAGGVNIVEDDVMRFGIEIGATRESGRSLGEALGAGRAELDGVRLAREDRGVDAAFEFGEMFGKEGSMVETALADVTTDGGNGDDDEFLGGSFRMIIS